jgi:formyltetrahydrofolate hydrolase
MTSSFQQQASDRSLNLHHSVRPQQHGAKADPAALKRKETRSWQPKPGKS